MSKCADQADPGGPGEVDCLSSATVVQMKAGTLFAVLK